MRWVRGIFRFLACGVTCEDKLLERHVNVTYAFGLIFAVTTVSFVCFAACGLRGLRHRYTTR
jgi:hypothetical protein